MGDRREQKDGGREGDQGEESRTGQRMQGTEGGLKGVRISHIMATRRASHYASHSDQYPEGLLLGSSSSTADLRIHVCA